MRITLSLTVGLATLVAACSEDQAAREAEIETALPGVYAGAFPCENCPGIEVTVWVRPDRRFFIRQKPGESAFVEFEGRFHWSGDGSLRAVTIEDFGTIKDGRTC